MITVNFKPVKGKDDELYINLSNGWTKKIKKDDLLSNLSFYLIDSQYRVFVDEFTDGLLNSFMDHFIADGYTPEQVIQNLKSFQFNKYMCSILKVN